MTESPKRVVDMTDADIRDIVREEMRAIAADSAVDRALLSPEQLAKELGCTSRTIYNYVETNGLPARRLGPRKLRFSWPEVDAWAKAKGVNIPPANDNRRRHLRPVRPKE